MTEHARAGKRRIVVGIDGSAPSRSALAWAIRQASLSGATVEAIIAWQYPTAYGYPVPMAPPFTPSETAEGVLSTAIAEVGHGSTDQVEIVPEVLEGNPAQVLLKASAGADLLVIGSRGHGGFVEALLGSTGQHCLHHASCPVVIIRDSVAGM
jgi:nucleotide-binding universal stress UspA family protein